MNKKHLIWIVVGLSVIGVTYYIYYKRKKAKNSGVNSTNDNGILEMIFDVNDKDYKSIKDKIDSAKSNVLSYYEKDGNTIRDKKTGNPITLQVSKTAYIMVTNDIIKEKNAVLSSYASNKKKNEVKQLVDSYINDYLPTIFDTKTYNINADWYKKIVAKI